MAEEGLLVFPPPKLASCYLLSRQHQPSPMLPPNNPGSSLSCFPYTPTLKPLSVSFKEKPQISHFSLPLPTFTLLQDIIVSFLACCYQFPVILPAFSLASTIPLKLPAPSSYDLLF